MLTAKRSGILATGVLALVLGWACPADAQTIRVGSFTKSTGGAPVAQVVPHGLGLQPKALILWTDRYAAAYGFLHAFGMTDGTTSRSAAMASQDGAAVSNSSRRIAAKALTIVQWGEALVAEADLASWDGNNFTLTWTTNDATADTIHFIAIGGPAVSAKVVDWTMAAAVGNRSVTGVGFSPDVVLHAHAGFILSGALPLNAALAAFGFGAMDRAGNQWANEAASFDNSALSDTQRGQVTNACLYAFNNALVVQKQASFFSMDADGFTVNFTNATSAVQSPVISLALKGVSAKAGFFNKSTTSSAPAFVAGQHAWRDLGVSSGGSITLPAASTTGNLIVVSFDFGYTAPAPTVSSITDNKGNTYSLAAGPTDWSVVAQGLERSYTYYAANITGGGANVTITVNLSQSSANHFEIYALEYSGVATVSPVDRTSARFGRNNGAVDSGSQTTTSPDELIYGFCMFQTSGTPTAPYTGRDTSSNNFVADRIVSAKGSYAATGTTGSNQYWACQMVTFKGGQSVAGMPFSPGAVLLASVQHVTAGAPVVQNRLGLGAADSAFHQGSSALTDEDGQATTNIWGTDTTTSAFVKSDNGTGSIDARAVLASFDVGGFTLDWTTNDTVATQIAYLAFGGLGPVGVGCGIGTFPTGPNFVQHGTFDAATQTPAGNNFTTGAAWGGVDACPGDTGVTIRTVAGPCGGNISITQFPGDPTAGVAAASNSLYTNGNNRFPPGPPYGPDLFWRQTVTGLQQNTTYTFFLYASNGNNPPVQPLILPTLRFCKGVTGTGPYACSTQLNAVDFSIPNETATSGDIWRRYQVTFTTGAGETTADLAVLDAATNTNGDDVQVTQIGVKACTPTAVELMSFAATALDGAVDLSWATGSELDSLGFHVYRSPLDSGPWTRLTASLIPGLGSSPLGQSYSWLDSGLTNGVRYYYRLEDVDTSSVSTFHGPVSAVPHVSAPPPPGGGGGGGGGEPGDGSGPGSPTRSSCPAWVLAAHESGGVSSVAATGAALSPTCTRHGEPESVSFEVVSRDASSATLELRTGGFWALHAPGAESSPSGTRGLSETVRVFVQGFDFPADSRAPALPLRRALVNAVVGKKVQLVSAETFDLRTFRGLRASAVGAPEVAVEADGTVRPARRSLAAPLFSRGYLPVEVARLAGTVFQGERKSAVVEITPVRFDGPRGELVLAGRVRVKLAFTGVEDGEIGTGSRGRALPRERGLLREVLAQVHTSGRGLYGVSYESLFRARARGFSTSLLRLQRQGEAVPFHVEPAGSVFGPGSVLYFYADRTAGSTDYSSEVAYELVRSSGQQMGVALGHPASEAVASSSTGSASFETNRIYQAGLLEAPDVWLWEAMVSGTPAKTETFTLSGVDTASAEVGQLVVSLQGGSESGVAVDHHVRASVNGVDVGEATFAGKQSYRLDAVVPAGLLREGSNDLAITNVGDTGVYSLVFLDKFEVSYPQASAARGGVFEGVWSDGGTAEVAGLSDSPIVVDVTLSPRGASLESRDEGSAIPANSSGRVPFGVPRNDRVRWVTGFATTAGAVRFEAEAGHRYVVASREGLLSPRIGRVAPSSLREGSNQADYLVIAPREFLGAAAALLERRRSEGLVSRGVSFEGIASEFGHGQPSAEAIKEFLSYAYHSWRRPSPRYVLLLGDSTYDPRHFVTTSWPSPLPALWAKTSYLWTASDPALAAVNGDDSLPDLAIGRLPATSPEQAEGLVSKLLAWEDSGQGLTGKAVLVADNPDEAGDFEADAEDIRASYLSGRETTTLKLSELGAGTRAAILDAFDEGAALMSYVGHGGTAVWASENVLNSWDMPSLRAQSQQPLLLTMNCLNGYFVAPNFDSLSEALVKAEGRGAIAAFSPSGLSVDGPAHQYHRAVMAELASGTHETPGGRHPGRAEGLRPDRAHAGAPQRLRAAGRPGHEDPVEPAGGRYGSSFGATPTPGRKDGRSGWSAPLSTVPARSTGSPFRREEDIMGSPPRPGPRLPGAAGGPAPQRRRS